MHILVRSLVVTLLICVPLAGSTDGTQQTAECPSAGAPRITAQQLSVSPPSYAFLVTNLTKVAISGIVVGKHDRTMRIRGSAPNIPVQMLAPSGWEGRHVHIDETAYLVYLWENKDVPARILPQQSVAGFRITLPTSTDTVQTTFERVPFKASLADGSCRFGFVGVDKVPR